MISSLGDAAFWGRVDRAMIIYDLRYTMPDVELGRPFRAGNCIGASFPGRCPGLQLDRAFGAGEAGSGNGTAGFPERCLGLGLDRAAGAGTSSRRSLDATTAGGDGCKQGFGQDARNNRLEAGSTRAKSWRLVCGESRRSLDATTAGGDGRTQGFGRDARNNGAVGGSSFSAGRRKRRAGRARSREVLRTAITAEGRSKGSQTAVKVGHTWSKSVKPSQTTFF
jgi:hypothetical protein